jgi:hypothetical protein
MCDDETIDSQLCNATQKGEWLLADNAAADSKM